MQQRPQFDAMNIITEMSNITMSSKVYYKQVYLTFKIKALTDHKKYNTENLFELHTYIPKQVLRSKKQAYYSLKYVASVLKCFHRSQSP